MKYTKFNFLLVIVFTISIFYFSCSVDSSEDTTTGNSGYSEFYVFGDTFSSLFDAPGAYQGGGDGILTQSEETDAAKINSGTKAYKLDFSTVDATGEWAGIVLSVPQNTLDLSAYSTLSIDIKAEDETKVLEKIEIENFSGKKITVSYSGAGVADPSSGGIKFANTNYKTLKISIPNSQTFLKDIKQIVIGAAAGTGASGVFYIDNIKFTRETVSGGKLDLNDVQLITNVGGTASTINNLAGSYLYDEDTASADTYNLEVNDTSDLVPTSVSSTDASKATATISGSKINVTGVAATDNTIISVTAGGVTDSTSISVLVQAADTTTAYYLLKKGGGSDFNGERFENYYGMNTADTKYDTNTITLAATQAGASGGFQQSGTSPVDINLTSTDTDTFTIEASAGTSGDKLVVWLTDAAGTASAQVQINGATAIDSTTAKEFTVAAAKFSATTVATNDIIAAMATGFDNTKIRNMHFLIREASKTFKLTEVAFK